MFDYEVLWKNLSNKTRDGGILAILRNIKHRIIDNLFKNTTGCKIHATLRTSNYNYNILSNQKTNHPQIGL